MTTDTKCGAFGHRTFQGRCLDCGMYEASELEALKAEIARQDDLIARMWRVLGKAEDMLNPGREHRAGMDPECDVCKWLDEVGNLTIILD